MSDDENDQNTKEAEIIPIFIGDGSKLIDLKGERAYTDIQAVIHELLRLAVIAATIVDKN